MRTAFVTLATIAGLMAFLAGMEWATKKLLLWLVTVIALGS